MRAQSVKPALKIYSCGEPTCRKRYKSYTAFYNHCKKRHGGEMPEGSLLNNERFLGPTKNRGRPRLSEGRMRAQQFRTLKLENNLLGVLGQKQVNSKSVIQYIPDPSHNLGQLRFEDNDFASAVEQCALLASKAELPELYDPYSPPAGKFDFNSFESVFRCLAPQSIENELAVVLVWLSRLVVLQYLEQVARVFGLVALSAKGLKLEQSDLLILSGHQELLKLATALIESCKSQQS